ncbi:MAG TPA: tRNA (adenosine(37)-N6)-threonylcarbamoyltransferase complex dimerization subunit type 1 TsaB [Casimicrobiaceae bacterium]|nr:tRNA (adenosine(37)-N6)-threonylcarbamoyltransferase complex dimerization subunit type 1 TsaB [Casimicrobiaceae bacterium]
MQILALDTSTQWLSVALFDGRTVVETRECAANASSARILPAIGELLARGETSLAQLDGIAYGAGPGSFTGLRIACGIAQGLAFGSDRPVFGVSTLEALAQAAWREREWLRVLACLDARMHEVYVAAYERKDNGFAVVREAAVCKPDEIDADGLDGFCGAGDAFFTYPALARRLGLADCDPSLIPDAHSIAQCAWPRVLAGAGVPAEQAQPLYVRHRVALTSAERAAGLRL